MGETIVLLLGDQLQILIDLGADTCLRAINFTILFGNRCNLILFINVSELALIHYLSNSVLLFVQVLNFEFVVSNNNGVLYHSSKVILTHHQILQSGLFCQLEQ